MATVESGGYVSYAEYEGPTLQELIDNGMAWRLEGFTGRQAMAAIENGDAMLGRRPHRDYWGNPVPAWWMVEPGTKGSPEFAGVDRADLDEPNAAEQCELLRAAGFGELPA